MSRIFRPWNEDSIPLRLEEFDASPLESQVWVAATTLCHQERPPYFDRIHPERIQVELRGLREYEQQELEKLIVALEKEVEELRARQTTTSERLSFAREHLEHLRLKIPEEDERKWGSNLNPPCQRSVKTSH